MRILVLGINYAPELVGIGPYTAQFCAHLGKAGNEVTAIAAKPYYPEWKTHDGYRAGYRKSVEDGVSVWRCPIYVPRKPNGPRRILHHLTFAMSALAPAVIHAVRHRPDVVLVVAPSLLAAPIGRLAGWLAGARTWLHVQDFEVEAAFATGLIGSASRTARLARRFEVWAMSRFTHYSSISADMCAKLGKMVGRPGEVIEFRNWANITDVAAVPSGFREEWGIRTRHVALYSGNLANKQGIGLIADAARLLKDRSDLTFIVCGEGSGKDGFVEATRDLPNVVIKPLQPLDRLQELLSIATMHLLPQLKGAADLVLPSKLTNMLASGRPVIATADPGTGLAREVDGCGLLTPPGDVRAFATAIEKLASNPAEVTRLGAEARERARQRWSKEKILGRIERVLREGHPARYASTKIVAEPEKRPRTPNEGDASRRKPEFKRHAHSISAVR